MDIKQLLRKNIANLTPYSSARDEFTGSASVFIDANENPIQTGLNRYPDPYQAEVKKRIADIKGVSVPNIFLGNGSDEPIDLLFRAFCEPAVDNIVSINPTYGMYKVCAEINNVEIHYSTLTSEFQMDVDDLLSKVNAQTKMIFICSPNNPTGNCLKREDMLRVIESFHGIVVIDEAYIDFAPGQSLLAELKKFENVVILQTFSKAWGLAGIRLGMAFASEEIVTVLNSIKYPYNINVLTQQKALEVLKDPEKTTQWVASSLQDREALGSKLAKLPFVETVYPSDANFLLVKMSDADGIFNYLMEEGIIVRNRSSVILCDNCLRITIGTPEENETLFTALRNLL